MATSLYGFVWRESGRQQLVLCALTLVLVPLSMVPLELQRRIVDDALGSADLGGLALLAVVYVAVVLAQGGIKYALNVYRGWVVETVVMRLRLLIYDAEFRKATPGEPPPVEEVARGGRVSMVAAESEDVGGFVGESLSIPLLQGGTMIAVLGYLTWVEPLIAGLAVALYLPHVLVVRWGQGRINRFAKTHAKLVRKLGDHIVVIGPATRVGDPHRRFARLAARTFDVRILLYRVKYFLTFFGNLLDALGPLIVLVVGGVMVVKGSTEVSTLVVFISGFQKIADPWDQIVAFYRGAANAAVKYRLIVDTIEPNDAPPAGA